MKRALRWLIIIAIGLLASSLLGSIRRGLTPEQDDLLRVFVIAGFILLGVTVVLYYTIKAFTQGPRDKN